MLPARCGNARLILQVDMGVRDAVWPAATRCVYPTLLELAASEILADPREAVVADEFEAMVVLGDRNSRIKDFFDLHYLAKESQFDRVMLSESVRRTFTRRRLGRDRPKGIGRPGAKPNGFWVSDRKRARCRGMVGWSGRACAVGPVL